MPTNSMLDSQVAGPEVEDQPVPRDETPQRILDSDQVHSEELAQEEIAALAYEFWVERGSPHGSHEEDWHRAEAELRGREVKTRSAHA
jgi:hypothetical protein